MDAGCCSTVQYACYCEGPRYLGGPGDICGTGSKEVVTVADCIWHRGEEVIANFWVMWGRLPGAALKLRPSQQNEYRAMLQMRGERIIHTS